MAESRKARVDRYVDLVEDTIKNLKKLNRSTIEHIVRASEETSEIDGYGAGGGTEKVSGSSNPDQGGPTAAALEAKQCRRCKGTGFIGEADDPDRHRCKFCRGRGERITADPLMNAVSDIFTSITEAHGHSRIINRTVPVVIHANDKLKGRPTTISPCQACNRNVLGTPEDPIVSGYCRACRKAWERAGYPERREFERTRRGEIPDDGVEWRIAAISDLQSRDELPTAHAS